MALSEEALGYTTRKRGSEEDKGVLWTIHIHMPGDLVAKAKWSHIFLSVWKIYINVSIGEIFNSLLLTGIGKSTFKHIAVYCFIFMCMSVFACMYISTPHVWSPQRPEEGRAFPVTVATGSCEPPCGPGTQHGCSAKPSTCSQLLTPYRISIKSWGYLTWLLKFLVYIMHSLGSKLMLI